MFISLCKRKVLKSIYLLHGKNPVETCAIHYKTNEIILLVNFLLDNLRKIVQRTWIFKTWHFTLGYLKFSITEQSFLIYHTNMVIFTILSINVYWSKQFVNQYHQIRSFLQILRRKVLWIFITCILIKIYCYEN